MSPEAMPAIEAVPAAEEMTAFDEALVQICLEELLAADGSQARIERQIAGMTQSLAFIIAVAAAGNEEATKRLLGETEWTNSFQLGQSLTPLPAAPLGLHLP